MNEFWSQASQQALEKASEEQQKLLKKAVDVSPLHSFRCWTALTPPPPQVASTKLDPAYARGTWHIAVSGIQRTCASLIIAQDHRLGFEAYHTGDNMLSKRVGTVHPKFKARGSLG